jgi:deoxyxylulose-5-phosphate synthase
MDLSQITHPNQLHGLSVPQLQQIARQIREKHLQTVDPNLLVQHGVNKMAIK